ncbi:MAG: hypothetical protein LW650_10555 [Planctomycetaceae bacterium]|nr:hypothetical protein [Planctomycetaceae bacterium]
MPAPPSPNPTLAPLGPAVAASPAPASADPAAPAQPETPVSEPPPTGRAGPAAPPPPPDPTTPPARSGWLAPFAKGSAFRHRLSSLLWLPYPAKSGLHLQRQSPPTSVPAASSPSPEPAAEPAHAPPPDHGFAAVLPFRRFNRNWYNAMAGASLLANSEISAGMFLSGRCGTRFDVHCEFLRYDFLLPVYGPAIYRIRPMGDLDAQLAAGEPFSIELDIEVVQQIAHRGRERRVGRAHARFTVQPRASGQTLAPRPTRDQPVLLAAAGASPSQPGAVETSPATAPLPQSEAGRPRSLGKRSFGDRFEAWFSTLTSRSTFWHRVGSLIWLPYAFRSGIRMQKVDDRTFAAELPFRRFNRNWHNAMADAALLANSEIAAGTCIHGRCGGDYTVVCKRLSYEFLRPCFGPAVYRITELQSLEKHLATGSEFNFDTAMDVIQRVGDQEVRIGACLATFHITPKAMHAAREARRKRGRDRSLHR